MISLVSFDYFHPFEYVDVGFTETWAWSPNFEWLGYESVNFLLGLGSIAVFAAIQFCVIFLALAIGVCRLKCPCKWGRNYFSPNRVWDSSLTFIHGVFFEILVCISVSMSLLPFMQDFLSGSDKISIGIAFFFMTLLVAYLMFVTYFACFKAKQIAEKHRAEVEERNLLRVDSSTHDNLIAFKML